MSGDTTSLPPSVFYVLLALLDRPRHGHGIKLDIARQTDGAIVLGPGTLYGTIKRMLEQELIREVEPARGETDRRKRRYYELTDLGRAAAAIEATRMERLVAVAESKRMRARTADES